MGLIACKVSEGGGVTKGWWTLVMGKEREKRQGKRAVLLLLWSDPSLDAKTNTRPGWGARTLYLRERCLSCTYSPGRRPARLSGPSALAQTCFSLLIAAAADCQIH